MNYDSVDQNAECNELRNVEKKLDKIYCIT